MARKSDLLTDSFATLQTKKSSRHFVTALSRGLEILDLFTRDVTALGNDEISQRCGLPRSTVTRLTYTLVTTRHLVYMPSVKKYKRSEEHTSELQSLMRISYAVFCLKQK